MRAAHRRDAAVDPQAREREQDRSYTVIAYSRAQYSPGAHSLARSPAASGELSCHAMCGIAGIVRYRDGAPVAKQDVESLRDEQRHRGPDDAGLWTSADGRVGFGHRRLAIVDLSPLGHQPMLSDDGRFAITFNGEIYNFRELRRELEARGHALPLDQRHRGPAARLPRVGPLPARPPARDVRLRPLRRRAARDAARARSDGDQAPLRRRRRAAALRSPPRSRPLRRVADDGGLDPEGLASFLLWGSIAAPRTLYRGIRALPPASWLRIRDGVVEAPVAYWRLEDELARPGPAGPEDAGEALRAALLDSVRQHMVADVPVGAFLSGGVDSSALVGLMSEVLPETGAHRHALARRARARRIAAGRRGRGALPHRSPRRADPHRGGARARGGCGARARPAVDRRDQHVLRLRGGGEDRPQGGGLRRGRRRALRRLPELRAGSADPAPARRARALAGRRRARRLGRARARAAVCTGRRPRSSRARCGSGATTPAPTSPSAGSSRSREVRELLAPELAEAVQACDPIAELRARVRPDELPEDERVCALEFRQYLQMQLLRDTDAMAMRHSLEVRTPLVDRELLRAAVRVPAALRRAGPAKRRLREAPRPPVPAALWQRRKQGFTLPFDRWLRTGGIPLKLPEHAWLRPAAVERLRRGVSRGPRPLVAGLGAARSARVPRLSGAHAGSESRRINPVPRRSPPGRRSRRSTTNRASGGCSTSTGRRGADAAA